VGLPALSTAQFRIKVFDGAASEPNASLVYDSNPAFHAPLALSPQYTARRSLALYGRELVLQVDSLPRFEAGLDHASHWLILLAGFVISALLGAHLRRRWSERALLQVMVEERTRDLRTAIEAMPAQMGYWDKNLINRLGNSAYAKRFGMTVQRLPGMHIREFIGEALYLQNLPHLEAALRGERQQFERIMPTTDGKGQLYTVVEYVPDLVEGQVRGFYVMVTDVSDIRTASASLREGSEVLHSILTATPDGYWQLDFEATLLEVNSRYCEMSGYTREELLQMPLMELMVAESPDVIAERRQHAMTVGYAEFETSHRRKDGSIWDVGVRILYRSEAGGQFFAFFRDITERQAMEQALAQQHQLLQDVVESLPFGLVVYDKHRQMLLSNTRLATKLHLPAEFFDKPELGFDDIIRLNFERGDYQDQTLEATLQRFHAMLEAGKPISFERMERDGRWLEIHGSPLCDGGNILTYSNITERKENEQKLVTATGLAESANLAKSRFLATMSHEIRTPLNAVLGMAQVLMQPNIPESSRLDYVRTIFNSGQALLALLNDILDLSKIEAGMLELESIAVVPEQLIGDAKALFTLAARAKNLHIEAHWSGTGRRYLGDPNRLRQMLSNLVGNAIKFTKQGSIRIEASEVACTGQIATLEFAVVDSGIGIAPDKLKLLFQPFSQADSSTTREYGGSGLGLSIVRRLAQAMGGDAGVESEYGGGSRFWFRVQADLIATEVPGLPSPTELSALSYAAQPAQLIGRVLVIEDNPINQHVMQVMLGQMGLEVALADDGQQALDALMAGESAQLILTDLHMPVMDGYTAAQRIRQWEEQTQQTRRPIIAYSADVFAGVRLRCLAVGMDEMLSKPVLIGDLWAALAQWLPAAAVAPHSAPVPVALKTLDRAAITALLNDILPLLAQGKADAIDRFKTLQELVAGSALGPEMAEAGLPLKKFRFDLTLARLRQMASQYEWKIKA
jgi:PAS domain S-box-containing protein